MCIRDSGLAVENEWSLTVNSFSIFTKISNGSNTVLISIYVNQLGLLYFFINIGSCERCCCALGGHVLETIATEDFPSITLTGGARWYTLYDLPTLIVAMLLLVSMQLTDTFP